jgi:hypothetical protein
MTVFRPLLSVRNVSASSDSTRSVRARTAPDEEFCVAIRSVGQMPTDPGRGRFLDASNRDHGLQLAHCDPQGSACEHSPSRPNSHRIPPLSGPDASSPAAIHARERVIITVQKC